MHQRRRLAPSRLPTLLLLVLLTAIAVQLGAPVIIASGPGNQGVQQTVPFYLIATGDYIFVPSSSTLYYDQAQVGGTWVYLLNASTSTNGVPPTLNFGVSVSGANATLTSITSTGVAFSITPSNRLMNLSYYYGYGTEPQAVIINGNYTIYQANFNVNGKSCVAPCVLVNTAAQTITVVADPSQIIISSVFPSANPCLTAPVISGTLTGSLSMLVVLPVIVIAAAIIGILFALKEGAIQIDGGSLILLVIVVIGLSVALIAGFLIISGVTNVATVVNQC